MKKLGVALLFSIASLNGNYENELDSFFEYEIPDAQLEIQNLKREHYLFFNAHRSLRPNPFGDQPRDPMRMDGWGDQQITKMHYHRAKGEEYFKQAEDRTFFLPDSRSYKSNVMQAFVQARIIASSGSGLFKGVVMISALFFDYGIDCMEEYKEINTLIRASRYHFEMANWYESTIPH